MLRVAQICFHHDPEERRPTELLRVWRTLGQLATAARDGGAEVQVVQASRHVEQHWLDGIACSFGPLDTPRLRNAIAHADVLHVQGLGFSREVLRLADLAQGRPILLQDRADRPPTPWRRNLWRAALSEARGLLFCSHEQSLPFAHRGLIGERTRVYELPGLSSPFTPGDREEARRMTGIDGDPTLLWVANLDANKDPLTVIEALALTAEQLPQARLWCCFGQAPLLEAVQARITQDPRVAGRVHLLGTQPHAHIEQLMRAADFLVQGSHREANGCSVIEALSCGLPPLITDIAPFRALLGSAPGSTPVISPALWRPGDAASLAASLLAACAMPPQLLRRAARARFEAALSTPAIGRRLVDVYRDLLS